MPCAFSDPPSFFGPRTEIETFFDLLDVDDKIRFARVKVGV